MLDPRWYVFVTALLLLVSGACRKKVATATAAPELAPYAALPGASKSHNDELQAELARLFAEEATPLQLMSAEVPTRSTSDDSSPNASAEYTAKVTKHIERLDVIFPSNFRESAMERIDKVWPEEGFEFTPATMHVVGALSDRYRMKREKFEQLVSEPKFRMPVDHSRGLSADTSYLDAIKIGHRLIGLRAAELIAANRPEAAVDSFRIMLRTSELLAGEKHLASRNAGAMRRGDALQVLRGIVQHASTTQAVQEQLRLLVDQQLQNWPKDADTWIGDRAQGLHTYELVRGGYLLSLLSYEELREYREEVGIQELAQVVADNIDVDEVFYLQTMRDIIDVCSKPHYERTFTFQRIESNLELLRESDEYPFVADQLLLLQLEDASRLMALDRARCEAWVLALKVAIDGTSPSRTINPLTGDEFFVDMNDQRVIVDAIDSDGAYPAAIVPRVPQDKPVSQLGSPLIPATTR